MRASDNINRRITDKLQQIASSDPEAVVWLRASCVNDNAEVEGKLTVKGEPDDLVEVAEILIDHCHCRLALYCAKRDRKQALPCRRKVVSSGALKRSWSPGGNLGLMSCCYLHRKTEVTR